MFCTTGIANSDCFFFQAEDGIRDFTVTGVQTCALPIFLEGSWGIFELDVEHLMEPLPERILYEDVITYPAARQDVAVAVPETVEAGAILAEAREAGGDDLREVRI